MPDRQHDNKRVDSTSPGDVSGDIAARELTDEELKRVAGGTTKTTTTKQTVESTDTKSTTDIYDAVVKPK